jgi:hypothetical protein
MRFPALLAALLLALGRLAALEVDPVPADATWILHCDVRQALQPGPLGDALRQIASQGKARKDLAGLAAITGLDPLRHLERITLSGVGADKQAAVLLAVGTFERERLEVLAQTLEGHESARHGETAIHSWVDENEPGKRIYAAFHGPRHLAMAGSASAVRRQLDALRADPAKAPAAGPLATLRAQTGTLVMVGAVEGLDRLPADAANARMLRGVREGLAVLSVEGDQLAARVAVRAADEASAVRLHQVAQGLAALVAMSGDERHPVAEALLSTLQVAREGMSVTATARCPVAALLHAAEARRGAGERPAPIPAAW